VDDDNQYIGARTHMWCPICEEIRCTRVDTRDSYDQQRRCSSATHPDLNWFRRERICLSCKNEFSTAEVDEAQLLELLRRDAVLVAFEQCMHRCWPDFQRLLAQCRPHEIRAIRTESDGVIGVVSAEFV
jgi:hypothetical protein